MIELKKLRTLAEAGRTERDAVDQFFSRLETEVEAAYDAIKVIRTSLQSQVLTDMVKRLGHPATESKDAKADVETAFQALRAVEEEISDLYRALAMSSENELTEAAKTERFERTMSSLKAEKKIIDYQMRRMDDKLPRECRHKDWYSDEYSQTVVWVTQESTPRLGREAAKTIAKVLTDAGVSDWTVKVALRDDYTGVDKTTTWQGTVEI